MAITRVDYLKPNRGLILSRALVAGAAGLLPVPYLDDLLAGAVRSALVRRLAEIRSVDLDGNAVEELAHPHGSRLLGAATLGSIALSGTRRVFRKVAASLLVVRRADEAMQTFQVGTLFDHYCARHHVGAGLDGKRAATLRISMDAAIKQARSESLARAFKNALATSGRVASKLPRSAFAFWSRRQGGPLAAERVGALDEKLDAAATTGFVRRAVQSVEAELSSVQKGYVSSLCGAFDGAWAAATAERP